MFNLHNTHQKSNCQTLFLRSEKQNNWKTTTGQKFRRRQKFRLTLVKWIIRCETNGNGFLLKTDCCRSCWGPCLENILACGVCEKQWRTQKILMGVFIQWHVVVISIWCVLFVTSQFHVAVMFPNQGFGEVCWQNMHIFLHPLPLFYVSLHWI